MVTKRSSNVIKAIIVDEQSLSLLEICRALGLPAETIIEMVEYGIVEPVHGHNVKNWEFSVQTLKRTRTAVRLQRDLHINLEGLGLAMNLLEEVQQLRRRVQFLEDSHPDW